MGRAPSYIIRDPEILKALTIKHFEHFEDHRPSFTSDDLASSSLIVMQGDKWRDMRSTLSPAFTGNKMRKMLDLIVEIADEMTQYMVNDIGKNGCPQWEVKDLVSRYTNDAIATSAFGIKVNSMEDPQNDFMLAGKEVRDRSSLLGTLKLMVIMIFPRLSKALDLNVNTISIA